MNNPRPTRGFTLVEIMIVISIMGILFTLAIPYFEPNSAVQLQATAEVVASDIAFARSMAVSRGSQYRLTFDVTNNEYVLTHSGSTSAFDKLPSSPYHYDDTTSARTTRLDALPGIGKAARIAVVYAQPTSGSPVAATSVEFQPLGNTTRRQTTVVWLQIGVAAKRRYIPIEINPVTGLETIGEMTDTLPTT